MGIEDTVGKPSALPVGAIDPLAAELSRRISRLYPEILSNDIVHYVNANNLSVSGATKEYKEHMSENLQEPRESADNWFINE